MVSKDQPSMASRVEEAVPTPAPDPGATIAAEGAFRLVLFLLAVWTVFSALALIIFRDGSGATIGGGLEGGEGEAAQRLLGVHLLILAPIYALLAWEPRKYRVLLWVPYVAQAGVIIVSVYDIVTNKRDFTEAALPLIVSSVFLAMLIYVWRAGRQPEIEATVPESKLLPKPDEPPPSTDGG
jgi:hypothetical protein